ncbi:MAG TPA: hypothetical protein VK961_04810 [Chthoniobacter sp.]|nr:hypothetical protein [Chthoniobacter sp.]
MKTIIWKELRENLKWAALAILCLTLAQTFALYQQRDNVSSIDSNVTLCSSAYLLVGLVGCVIVGAGLGILQILPEQNRDRWAALLHRPISRSTLFLGKVAAGLLLYLLATLIPLLVSVVYVAMPGQFPTPFIPGMIVPAASNVALGVAFYSLALLVSLTRGRRFGRRALLVLSVLPLFVFHFLTPWIFLPPLVLSLLLLTAACGVMSGNGSVRSGFVTARFGFNLVMVFAVESALVLLLLAVIILSQLGHQDSADSVTRHFVVSREGKVLLNHYAGGSFKNLTELDGTSITDERYTGNEAGANLIYPSFLTSNLKSELVFSQAEIGSGPPREAQNYLEVVQGTQGEGEYWYYLVGKNYFVGYDKLNRRPAGICDRDGFHSVGTTPKPFPIPLANFSRGSDLPPLFWAEGQLYRMDFGDRRMQRLFTAPTGRIYAVMGLSSGNKTIYFALALENSLQLLDPLGAPIVSIPYSHDVNVWNSLSACTLPGGDRIFVQYTPDDKLSMDLSLPARPTFFDEYDRQGKLLHSYSTVTNPASRATIGRSGLLSFGVMPLLPTAIAVIAAPVPPQDEPSFAEFLAELSLQRTAAKVPCDPPRHQPCTGRRCILVGAPRGIFAQCSPRLGRVCLLFQPARFHRFPARGRLAHARALPRLFAPPLPPDGAMPLLPPSLANTPRKRHGDLCRPVKVQAGCHEIRQS